MKIFSFILSIYLITLSGITCADTDIHAVVSKSTAISQYNHNESTSDGADKDLCSPFCSCSCCGIQVVNNLNAVYYDFPVTILEISPKVPLYQSLLTSSFTGSIWQPPQINS